MQILFPCRLEAEPAPEVRRIDNDRHAAMDRRQRRVRRRRDDGAGAHRPVRAVPALPQAGEGERPFVLIRHPVRHFRSPVPLPFVETVGGNQAASVLPGAAEARLFCDGLGPSVGELGADLHVPGPGRDQPPARLDQRARRAGRSLDDRRHVERRCNIVHGRPVQRRAVIAEQPADRLFRIGQGITAAHRLCRSVRRLFIGRSRRGS